MLASKGAKVYLAARSKDKYDEALIDIRASHSKTVHAQIEFLKLDLSSARSVKEAAEDFKAYVAPLSSPGRQYGHQLMYESRREKELHILYNNAGVMGTPKGTLSEDGYEYVPNPLSPSTALDIIDSNQGDIAMGSEHLRPLRLDPPSAPNSPPYRRIIGPRICAYHQHILERRQTSAQVRNSTTRTYSGL